MIKINLVAEGRKPVVKRPAARRGGAALPDLGGENIAVYMLGVGIVLFGLVFGGWWWMLRGTINDNRDSIRVAQKRVDELKDIIAQVEEFERQEAELDQKIDVITQLKNNQRGPVDIMDQISRALPELMWLDRLDQNGSQVTVSGRAFNSSAIENFIKDLDDSPIFDEPTLNDITQRNDIYLFTLVLTKVSPSTDLDEEAA